jgi:hypothetical protein
LAVHAHAHDGTYPDTFVAWPLQPLDVVQAGVQNAPPYPLAQLLHRQPAKPAEHVQLHDGR